jgi:signal transduction histidine kinase
MTGTVMDDHGSQSDWLERLEAGPAGEADRRVELDAARDHGDRPAQAEALLAELERVEAQFAQLREHLTHTHRLATLGTLSSVVAHEYNNVLTPVINYARLALSEGSDPELMRKALNKCLDGAQRATQISHSLLGFSRQDEAPAEANLRETIEEAIACLGRDPAKDGIELRTDLPEATVAMNPLNLQQVVVNLVLNAKKAMRRTGGRLELRGRVVATDARGGEMTSQPARPAGSTTDQAGDRQADQSEAPQRLAHEGGRKKDDEAQALALEVADTGPGIPAAIRDQLFEPFVTQPHEPHEPRTENTGTGLGLCICRDLVRAAGGRIDVQSEPGEGTTFTLTLPFAQSDPVPENPNSADREHTRGCSESLAEVKPPSAG